jgi:predicted amidohydrolase
MKERMNIAAVQLGPSTGNRQEDEDSAEAAVRAAALAGAALVLLPEIATLPYFAFANPALWRDLAEPVEGRLTQRFAALARQIGIVLVLPLFERGSDGRNYNSVAVFGPDGNIVPAVDQSGTKRLTARKLHLAPAEGEFDELDHFIRGEAIGVHRVDMLSFGCLICYDRRFPETWRALRSLGADLALVPVAGPGGDDSGFFLAELRTHARENGLYACAANKIGIEFATESAVPSHGDSCIVSPNGDVLALRPGDAGPGIVQATIDLVFLAETRRRFPFYEQRRPDLVNHAFGGRNE